MTTSSFSGDCGKKKPASDRKLRNFIVKNVIWIINEPNTIIFGIRFGLVHFLIIITLLDLNINNGLCLTEMFQKSKFTEMKSMGKYQHEKWIDDCTWENCISAAQRRNEFTTIALRFDWLKLKLHYVKLL